MPGVAESVGARARQIAPASVRYRAALEDLRERGHLKGNVVYPYPCSDLHPAMVARMVAIQPRDTLDLVTFIQQMGALFAAVRRGDALPADLRERLTANYLGCNHAYMWAAATSDEDDHAVASTFSLMSSPRTLFMNGVWDEAFFNPWNPQRMRAGRGTIPEADQQATNWLKWMARQMSVGDTVVAGDDERAWIDREEHSLRNLLVPIETVDVVDTPLSFRLGSGCGWHETVRIPHQLTAYRLVFATA